MPRALVMVFSSALGGSAVKAVCVKIKTLTSEKKDIFNNNLYIIMFSVLRLKCLPRVLKKMTVFGREKLSIFPLAANAFEAHHLLRNLAFNAITIPPDI